MKRQVYERQRRSIRMLLLMLSFFLGIIFLLIRLDRYLRPTVEAACEETCRFYAAQLIGQCMENVLATHSYSEQDFATLHYDADGNINAVETVTGNINRVQTQLLTEINRALAQSQDAEMTVSLGTASGVWLFAGRGPEIPMRFLPIGNASVQLISALESAGINQTCHTVSVHVTLHVAGAIPFYQTQTELTYDYLLTETLLVGNVPEAYAVFGE